MKTGKFYMILAIIAILTLGTGVAFAERPCFSALNNLPGIDLTKDQKAKLEAKEIEHRKKMIRLRSDLSIAKLEKQNMMKNRNFKKEGVSKQIKKITGIKNGMQMAKLDVMVDLRDTLTDEQWETFRNSKGKKGCGSFGKKGGHHGKKFKDGKYYGRGKGGCPYYDKAMNMED